MKALVTGFEPFGGDTVNPSEEAVQLLQPRIGTLEVTTCILPSSYAGSTPRLVHAIEATKPDIVLCVGQAGGRTALSLERIGINVQDARIPDNDRAQPIDVPVVPRGPAAYFATLPIKAAVAAMRQAGLPAEVSNTAGTFVCNHILYSLMHLAAQGGQRFRGGFLHIPFLPEQAAAQKGVPSMALADIVRGIEIILQTAAMHDQDLRVAEGAIS